MERTRGNEEHMTLCMTLLTISYKTAAVWAGVVCTGTFFQRYRDQRAPHAGDGKRKRVRCEGEQGEQGGMK